MGPAFSAAFVLIVVGLTAAVAYGAFRLAVPSRRAAGLAIAFTLGSGAGFGLAVAGVILWGWFFHRDQPLSDTETPWLFAWLFGVPLLAGLSASILAARPMLRR